MDEGKLAPALSDTGLVLKPVIKELARTQVCFPDIKLLVDRISIVTLAMNDRLKENQTYRLHLTDGEKTIQAVLKRKIHKHITHFDVREGSYVILRSYRLAKGKKLNGNGNVLYILIEDFYSIGDDNRDPVDNMRHDLYSELIRTPRHQLAAPIYGNYRHTKRRIFDPARHSGSPKKKARKAEILSTYDSTPASVERSVAQVENFPIDGSQSSFSSSPYSPTLARNVRKRDHPFDEIDLNLTNRSDNAVQHSEDVPNVDKFLDRFGNDVNSTPRESHGSKIVKHLEISYERELDGNNAENRSSQDKNDSKPALNPNQKNAAAQYTQGAKYNQRTIETSPPYNKAPNLSPRQSLLPIKRPLCIRTLQSVSGVHASRNKVFDFFAVIYSIEAQVVKPPMMPLKRDMRIVDPSTDKKVLVSVFVNPLNFKPSVGTIALFRSLTTHEWDRGMLNAYPQQCEGKNWFIVDPVGVKGCDVPALRNWWRVKSTESDTQGKGPD